MDIDTRERELEPLPGWVCAAVGIGFIVFLTAAIICVLKLGGG
jgi:hypothetical protein